MIIWKIKRSLTVGCENKELDEDLHVLEPSLKNYIEEKTKDIYLTIEFEKTELEEGFYPIKFFESSKIENILLLLLSF